MRPRWTNAARFYPPWRRAGKVARRENVSAWWIEDVSGTSFGTLSILCFHSLRFPFDDRTVRPTDSGAELFSTRRKCPTKTKIKGLL
jgi:hypothetical protein